MRHKHDVLSKISLTEELILLMLDEKTGYLEVSPGWEFSCVMAGTVIADLTLRGRIDTDLERLYLTDPTPTGDDVLDMVLQEIAATKKVYDTQYWIEKNTSRVDHIISTYFDRLVDRKIIVQELGGFFSPARLVSRSGIYPSNDLETYREAKLRITELILNDTIPDPHDAILVAMMNVCIGFKHLLHEEDHVERQDRIDWISKLDLVGRTVATAVKNSTIRPRLEIPQIKPVPKVKMKDILRQKDFFRGWISRGLYGLYKHHGPIMKMPFDMKGHPLYVMVGQDANQWFQKHGRYYLRTKEFMRDIEHEIDDANASLHSSDGSDHFKMRKSMKDAYSRSALGKRLPDLYEYHRSFIGKWKEGDEIAVGPAFRRLARVQVSRISLNVDVSEFEEELMEFIHRVMMTHGLGLPSFILKTPKMKRYRKYAIQLKDMVIQSHTPRQRKGKPVDMADKFLEINRNAPYALSELDLTYSIVSTMFVSIYMGSTLAFIIHCLLKNPDIHEAVYKEAEKIFGNGKVPKEKDFSLENIDVTHRVILESARMFAVVPWQVRGVVNQFKFDNYEIPSGSRLILGGTAAHYDEDLFRNPNKFDIDRYLPERAEHKQPGTYAPYGLGTHTCPGQRQMNLQLVVNTMLLVYHLNLELVNKNRELKINPLPTSSPRKNVKFRVVGIRNPIPAA